MFSFLIKKQHFFGPSYHQHPVSGMLYVTEVNNSPPSAMWPLEGWGDLSEVSISKTAVRTSLPGGDGGGWGNRDGEDMWTQGLFISMYDKIHYKNKKLKKKKKK